jgi:hypothetical protein
MNDFGYPRLHEGFDFLTAPAFDRQQRYDLIGADLIELEHAARDGFISLVRKLLGCFGAPMPSDINASGELYTAMTSAVREGFQGAWIAIKMSAQCLARHAADLLDLLPALRAARRYWQQRDVTLDIVFVVEDGQAA